MREDGSCVPLIPADELPHNVRLRGVDRVVNSSQSAEMHFVGHLSSSGRLFVLDEAAMATAMAKASAPDERQAALSSPSSGAQSPVNVPAPPEKPAPLSQTNTGKSATSTRKRDSATATNAKEVPPPSAPSARRSSSKRPEKVYCSYWLRTGECDYAQQGCKYKHQMPDMKTLHDIGFRSVPKWWLEKIVAMSRNKGGQGSSRGRGEGRKRSDHAHDSEAHAGTGDRRAKRTSRGGRSHKAPSKDTSGGRGMRGREIESGHPALRAAPTPVSYTHLTLPTKRIV